MTSRILIKKDLFYLILIGVVLILIAGLRPIGIDRDSLAYVGIVGSDEVNINLIDKEPGFWLIYKINKIIFNGNTQCFFLIYALLGVSLKIFAIKKYSLLPFFSTFTYVCLYFILHEMTQIRAGVAAAIFLLALQDIKDKNLKSYLVKTMVANMFHYSAIIMLLVYPIKPNKINIKVSFMFPIIGLFFAFFKNIFLSIFSTMTSVLPKYLSHKIDLYISLLNVGIYSDINIFNFFYTSLLFIYYLSLLNYRRMKAEYDIIFIKILGIMLFMFYFLSFLPVFAYRVSKFFGVVLIFLIPHILLAIKQKTIASIPIVILLLSYFTFIMVMRTLNL